MGRHKTVPIASTSGGGLITIGTAWLSAPLYAGQRFPLFSLQPIRSGECANDPADGADHARAEGRDRIAECVRIHDSFMVAQLASHGQRANAVLAHVGERHWAR